jgi:hypothetical protein
MLGVSRSGYYAWRSRPPSVRSMVDADLTRAIIGIHQASRGTYGRPRIHAELRYEGTRCSAKRVARLMRAAGITGIPHVGSVAASPGGAPVPPRTRTSSADGSPHRLRTGCGSPTSPTSRPERDGCTWPRSWTAALAAWWAGQWPIISAPSSSSTPWRWPHRGASQGRGSSTTPTRDRRAESSGRRNTSSWRWVYGTTTGLGSGGDAETTDAIARPAAGRAEGASTGVLGGDRSGRVERGCRGRGWCVTGGWVALVP